MMKRLFCLALLCLWLALPLSQAAAHNPFTAKPEKQHAPPAPVVKSKIFVKIILWQQQLRAKMSGLIREAKATGKMTPLIVLLGAAFLYGVVHSAGPGHGKAVALSYIFSCKPGLMRGLIFGNILALTHGCSGIALVLGVKFIFQTSMSGSLETMTFYTQAVSFGLISALGFAIFGNTLYRWIRKTPHEKSVESVPPSIYQNPMLTAMAVGIVPCPGVVMVMLFSISMGMTWLGMILGVTIALGMASTITLIVLAGMSGKAALLGLASKKAGILHTVQHGIEALAGLAVALIGLMLLGTVL
ncbi:MAG TPA: hypothetical protein DHV36_04665 [Desulfobacteraceae bacterium]|nr:hypothetical protein [Desulfobacteraceae bacterium]